MNYKGQIKLILGDCLDKLKELDDNSVDSIVTDPPYGLSAAKNSGNSSKGGFMGKLWDYDVPTQAIWEECLRVLKPGGHLLAFAGSRTYHRMAVRIEDAGFEIRDQIMWIYGSGFPKSMDISKQIDKKAGVEREVIGQKIRGSVDLAKQSGSTYAVADANKNNKAIFGYGVENLTKPATDGAKKWEGWGTALKPAHEPIVMARKPIEENTVADNVLKYGTGGINIDGCRVETDDKLDGGATNGSVLDIDGFDRPWMHDDEKMIEFQQKMQDKVEHAQNLGRFPANVILDDVAGEIMDEQSGVTKSGKIKEDKSAYDGESTTGFLRGVSNSTNQHGDTGGASRFFYCPKVSKSERNEGLGGFELTSVEPKQNFHPTVKPTDLMAYLIRLVTQRGGIVLDPFMGSGSTGKAAVREGMNFIGIEMEQDYFELAEARIDWETENPMKPNKKKSNPLLPTPTNNTVETDYW